MLLLRALSAHAAAPCEDSGPWPCSEEGCPAPSVTCAQLAGECDSRFDKVWKTPPSGLGGGDQIWQHCPVTCRKCGEPGVGGTPAAPEAIKGKCISWRQTKDCSASAKRQPAEDKTCDFKIKSGWSGYCECEGGIRAAESGCERREVFTCEQKCGEQWAYLRKAREQHRAASVDASGKVEEAAAFDADDSLTKLFKRGRGFYVMGNTELALRHFREALKLDPEHKECKDEYKQAKKLSKVLDKIEGVMGKEVEGKGRQGKLDRDEQYEEARGHLTDAIALAPPAVYRASLYRDLCICHTKLKRPEDALDVCGTHTKHDSGSIASKLLWAEALLLNEKFTEGIDVYNEVLEADEHSQEARKGLDQAQKLLKRSKEEDFYKTLNVSRSASAREIKRAYHKMAVQYHPDKVAEEEREAADVKFKAVAAAYEVLSDEDKRAKYDAGEDVTANPEQEQQQGRSGFMHHNGQHVHVHFQ